MRFSQRIGKTSIRESLQIEYIDQILEIKLWNFLQTEFFNDLITYDSYEGAEKTRIYKEIWLDFFNYRIDEFPIYTRTVNEENFQEYIETWYFESHWYEKYDFIEFIVNIPNIKESFINKTNELLKTQMSGYRIVNKMIVQITSNEEIEEIQSAIDNSNKWNNVETHLLSAVNFLSNRTDPDYRNSIKESISAVEALCIIVTGDSKATLGKALKLIEDRYKMHNSLKKTFSSLYGFTSDSGGIRHSLLEYDIEVTMEDAKFMLITCSAFINYLKAKLEK